MDTLIPISGGYKSAWLLARWLKSHPGHVRVLHCRTGTKRDNDGDRSYTAIRAFCEQTYPGRVTWHDAAISTMWDAAPAPAEVLDFLLKHFIAIHKIKNVITPIRLGLGKIETVTTVDSSDVLIDLPDHLISKTTYCEDSILPCGTCPACAVMDNARKQIGR